MARLGQQKSKQGDRLSDNISIGALSVIFPASIIDEVLTQTQSMQQRTRLLPSRVVVYFTLAMCLFARESYTEVMELLVRGLRWSKFWNAAWELPSDAALTKARQRLGEKPLRELFERVAKPLATNQTPGSWFHDKRVVAIDGTVIDVVDSKENEKVFARPSGGEHVPGPFPQARVVGLIECGTHAVFAASIGSCREGERSLMTNLLDRITPEMLVICDRGFWSCDLWVQCLEKTDALLWRVTKSLRLPVEKELSDGSYLSHVTSPTTKKQHRVRVITYVIGKEDQNTTYRLVTSLLDENKAPAKELAALYCQRSEIELAFDELKAHQRGNDVVLRSKYPETVRQEIYAHLCVHFAIRSVMTMTAAEQQRDPDQVSFLNSLRILRRDMTAPATFSPA